MGVNGPKRDSPAFVVRAFWRSSCGRTLSFKTLSCSTCGDEQPTAFKSDLLIEQLGLLPAAILDELEWRIHRIDGRTS